MKEYKHLAKVNEQGKLSLYHENSFREDLRAFNGLDIEIVLRSVGKRSNRVNRYYWGAVIPIIRTTLYELGIKLSSEGVHDLLKFKFIKQELVTTDGEVINTIGRSSELNTQEFTDYIKNIQQWSAEYLGIEIPDPNKQLTLVDDPN